MTKFREAECIDCHRGFFTAGDRGPLALRCDDCRNARRRLTGWVRQNRLRRKGKRMSPRSAALPAKSRGHPAEAIELNGTTSQRHLQIPPNDRGRGGFAKGGGRDLSPLPCSLERINHATVINLPEIKIEHPK